MWGGGGGGGGKRVIRRTEGSRMGKRVIGR